MSYIQNLIAFFEDSSIADSIRENDTLFPTIESIHVVAICLVVGSILVLDLRLVGFASMNRPVGRLTRAILPVTWGAFAIAASSGFLLFISNATKYLANGYFDAKIILICTAGVNMIVFHAISAKDLPQWEKQKSPPLRARIAGALSILLWIAVVACGRWIGFTMQEL
ncbi:hypothetical protein UP09_02885 [Bradyrhizobium sp. LTSP885]|uniref:DUF6644 family protein n=1 Tax=Bradyrhizobium sp. LTSP885 TaxID=1619232 RepID=UPI0005CA34A5|nr:DUF6644 family protein [Bradyrhizobium sp. LTSP885]KJC51016.1 hypothetical protein UP09_02885 [Bradyrhizobium sp. LTSP885]